MSYIYNLVDTWASGGGPYTSIKMNATDNDTGSASLLMDLQVGTVSQFKVSKAGITNVRGDILPFADNGINIGSNALRINTITAATAFRLTSFGSFDWTDTFLTRKAAANLRFGAADAAAPVAQTLSVQSVVAGTTNTAGTNLTITGAQGTGTGTGGSIVFQVAPAGSSGSAQNALATAVEITSAGIFKTKEINTLGAFYLQLPSALQNAGNFATGTNGALGSNGGAFVLGANKDLCWSDTANNPAVTVDLRLLRDAANTLALRNGTAAQRFNVYNTWTTATNYEAFKIDWITTANTVLVGTEKGSGGGTARDLEFQRDGTTQIVLGNGETRVGAGASPLITFGQTSVSTSARFGFYGGVQLVNSTVGGVSSLRLTNGALSDFGALQFGGTTSSFPALKRNGTALETKLADDTAYAPHAMQYLDVTDGVTAPASATGRARIYVDTADGDLKVIFADGTVKTIVTDT